jgi:hypothetical protein
MTYMRDHDSIKTRGPRLGQIHHHRAVPSAGGWFPAKVSDNHSGRHRQPAWTPTQPFECTIDPAITLCITTHLDQVPALRVPDREALGHSVLTYVGLCFTNHRAEQCPKSTGAVRIASYIINMGFEATNRASEVRKLSASPLRDTISK